MRSDALVAFVPIGAALSLVGAAATPIFSNVLDLMGVGVGIAPPNIIGVPSAIWGTDFGIGSGNRPELNISIGTAVTAAAGTLLKIALQAAPDQGLAGGFQPGTWQDVVSQDNIAPANLTAGAIPFRCPFIPDMPPGLLPRFMRLAFSPMSATALPSGSFTAGTIASAIVTFVRDDQFNKFQQKNYTVA